MNLSSIKGNIVPIPGMYNEDLSINIDMYKKFIEEKISDGDKIFYLAKSASEFKYMSQEERLKIAEVAGKYSNTDGVVILGQPLGSGSIVCQIEESKRMVDFGIDALVVLPTPPVMSGKFFSCHYEKSGFSEYVHGEYYVDYMEKFSSSISKPLVFHDAPLSNNIGLPENYLSQVMSINRVDGIKAHSPDPCSIHTIYNMFSKSKLCFDGFGKTLQFWSLKWGANARHTCWSWFDSNSDQDFFNSMAGSDYKRATDIIEREWKLAKEIKKTGFAGYKEIMRINGQIPNNLTRIPGLRVSKSEASDLYSSYNKYKNSIEL